MVESGIGNFFQETASSKRNNRVYRETSSQKVVAQYLSTVDQFEDFMRAEGLLRLPVKGIYIRQFPQEAYLTSDGRVIATYRKGIWPLRGKETRQYHLRDLSEVLSFLDGSEAVTTSLRRVSQQQLERAENLMFSSVRCFDFE